MSGKQFDLHTRTLATFIVFAVLTSQTLIIKVVFESNPESAQIVAAGFMTANVLAACTWFLFSD